MNITFLMKSGLKELKKELKIMANPEKAKLLQRFFKTGKGQYGEGDIFLGIIVAEQRKIAKKYSNLKINEIQNLLSSKIHEERLISLFILIQKYKKSDEKQKKQIFNFYLSNAKKQNINNWDMVDLSAPNILGDFILNNENKINILYRLANSNNLWEKRIAIISTAIFIKNNKFEDTIKISEILLNDRHDLIHKAVGWMFRELGKKDEKVLEDFLNKNNNYKKMPRTMLRYSIEKFPENKRQAYLKGNT